MKAAPMIVPQTAADPRPINIIAAMCRHDSEDEPREGGAYRLSPVVQDTARLYRTNAGAMSASQQSRIRRVLVV